MKGYKTQVAKQTPPENKKEENQDKNFPLHQKPNLGDILTKPTDTTKNVKEDKKESTKETKVKTNTYSDFDKQDDEQILQELKEGMITGKLIYQEEVEDEDSGAMVWVHAFSYRGVQELMKRQGNLEVVGVPFPEHTHTQFTYTVTCKDVKNNVSIYGQASEFKADEFSQRKALGKAQRNGFEKLIKKEIKLELFQELYEQEHKRPIDASEILIVGEYFKVKQK